ncbi:MAG: hypothetical protein JXB15_11555 [Anaerolineales bacterium]|nr:hypothetical protein [Anaerolineales bacterium]
MTKLVRHNYSRARDKTGRWLLLGLVVIMAGAAYLAYRYYGDTAGRSGQVLAWLREPAEHAEWAVQAGQRCAGAPFILPTSGLVGYLWDDSFRPGHRHQGIDIFGGGQVNETPVVAAFAGYLTRLPEWKSSVIIRIPEDPLDPNRQIWTYYTHMAGPDGDSTILADYPPGTSEVYVEEGALLGYQGNYSGTPGSPVGVHLHFSIVLDDGNGKFLNELEIDNTLDPSAYFGLPLNARINQDQIPICEGTAS